jgi:thymidylate synthase
VQYALLVMMFAQVSGLEAGELVHVISDAHIYNKHIPIIEELITRPQYPAPKVTLNPAVKDFYDFTTDDLTVENYQAGPQVKDIPIAV